MTRSVLQSIASFASGHWNSSKASSEAASSYPSSPSSAAQSEISFESTSSGVNIFSRFSSFNLTGGEDEDIFDERRANDIIRQYYPAWNGGRSEQSEN
ncbi:hypothetical protein I350_02485 [Cryptococcus amylolentus CBS 6273]|uniref:Uncharacterized protein n=1 Tax=Cryptococcus amylolentus CBS 6273 TaxID=1296118 RepID=A0A1E3KB83_9TREE|nr:hypothetical protein I350_02485 [Cryptococcus amylolentus CBS 6273]